MVRWCGGGGRWGVFFGGGGWRGMNGGGGDRHLDSGRKTIPDLVELLVDLDIGRGIFTGQISNFIRTQHFLGLLDSAFGYLYLKLAINSLKIHQN